MRIIHLAALGSPRRDQHHRVLPNFSAAAGQTKSRLRREAHLSVISATRLVAPQLKPGARAPRTTPAPRAPGVTAILPLAQPRRRGHSVLFTIVRTARIRNASCAGPDLSFLPPSPGDRGRIASGGGIDQRTRGHSGCLFTWRLKWFGNLAARKLLLSSEHEKGAAFAAPVW